MAAVTAAPKAAEHGDLAGSVREAQERIARAIRVGEMRGDPLCDVLEALSTSLGVQLQLHEAAAERARFPVDPAALVRLEEAAATGADRRAAKLAWAHSLRASVIGVGMLIGVVMMAGAGGYYCGRSSRAATETEMAAAAFRERCRGVAHPDALEQCRDGARGCVGKAVAVVKGRRACGAGLMARRTSSWGSSRGADE